MDRLFWSMLLAGCDGGPEPGDAAADTAADTAAGTDSADTADSSSGETGLVDADADGFAADIDCDDTDPAVFPDADEICNEIDDDCDELIDVEDPSLEDAPSWYTDGDLDGYGTGEGIVSCTPIEGLVSEDGDCDDRAPGFHPGATDFCNEKDDDCDLLIDEDGTRLSYRDDDGDGFGDDTNTDDKCTIKEGYSWEGGDCDLRDATVYPGAPELCDDKDNDCDSEVDEYDELVDLLELHVDDDGDGFGDPSRTTYLCEATSRWIDDASDCDDDDAAVHPDATEVCNDIDDDCDALVDDDDVVADPSTWYVDADADGYGVPDVTTTACDVPAGYAAVTGDCDDTDATAYTGATEEGDSADDDCDGTIDEGTSLYDDDGDGFSEDAGDCDDANSSIGPGMAETVDGVDEDCDGTADDGTSAYDDDGDGYTEDAGDCDDADAHLFPEAGGCPDGYSCADVLDRDGSAASGHYLIDPDGSGAGADAFEADCEMTIDGGGWTRAIPGYLDTLDASEARTWLFVYAGSWYRTPETTLVWSWSSWQELSGLYSHSSGEFECTSASAGAFGVGCAPAGDSDPGVYATDPASADDGTLTLCQAIPNAFGGAECQEGVALYVRP